MASYYSYDENLDIVSNATDAPAQLEGAAAGVVQGVFLALLAGGTLIMLLCNICPKRMVRINSVPWAFQAWFSCDIAYQVVLYVTLHELPENYVTHFTLSPDVVCWFAISFGWHVAPAAVLAAVLILHAAMLWKQSRLFSCFLLLAWALMAGVAVTFAISFGRILVAQISMAVLSGTAVLRVIGHGMREPEPPGVSSNSGTMSAADMFKLVADDFKHSTSLASVGKILFLMPVGIASEFAASLPFRLFVVHVFYFYDRLGGRIEGVPTWSELAEEAVEVRMEGWKGGENTVWMYRWLCEEFGLSDRPRDYFIQQVILLSSSSPRLTAPSLAPPSDGNRIQPLAHGLAHGVAWPRNTDDPIIRRRGLTFAQARVLKHTIDRAREHAQALHAEAQHAEGHGEEGPQPSEEAKGAEASVAAAAAVTTAADISSSTRSGGGHVVQMGTPLPPPVAVGGPEHHSPPVSRRIQHATFLPVLTGVLPSVPLSSLSPSSDLPARTLGEGHEPQTHPTIRQRTDRRMAAHLYQLSVNAEHQPLSAINQRRLANARPIDALIRLLSDAYIHDSDPLHKRMARRIKDGFDVRSSSAGAPVVAAAATTDSVAKGSVAMRVATQPLHNPAPPCACQGRAT